MRYQYLFRGHERRTFDLCNNGDWSRYLLVINGDTQFNTIQGVNLFTRDCDVTPGSHFSLWTALHIEYQKWNFEFGYNFWWRGREKIKVCGCLPENYYIYNLASGCSPTLTCSPDANISQGADGSNVVSSTTDCHPLTLQDLNLYSAAHPRCHTHKLYASLAYHGHQNHFPAMMGFAVSGEMSRAKSDWCGGCGCDRREAKKILDNWAVWVILGAQF